MSNLQYYTYAGFGQFASDQLGYNQAVRIDNRIEISGQGGWLDKRTSSSEGSMTDFPLPQDVEAQIDQAFINIDTSLRAAGGKGWNQVYKVTAYLAPLTNEAVETIVKNFKIWMPNHKPICTVLGVEKLALDGMKVEIEVVAYDKP